ncbi:SRPBCC family protein [Dactylosporangium sp. CA-233914]|uniref:SRPBCC family protein n=1 Tax=Dactylosporangium sp. CA-233914 TaxID=3239934 RepID=UPI003D8A3C85
MSGVASQSRHIGVHVDQSPERVYEYAADPANLPEWAPGLCDAVEREGDRWFADSGMGRIELTFAPANPFGVLDHDVRLPSGEVFHNPVRVVPHDNGSEIVFTLRRQDGMSDADFDRDTAAVRADLEALKRIVESPSGH